MLRDAGREEIRKVTLPLWTLLHSTQWPGQPGAFDPIKNGACAIVAHLAYCAVGDDERERKNRAKVVPCRVYCGRAGRFHRSAGERRFCECRDRTHQIFRGRHLSGP